MNPPRYQHWFFWFAVAIAAVVLSAYAFAGFQRTPACRLGWDAEPRGHAWFVAFVDSKGPAAGRLATGDLVLKINGSDRAAEFGPSGDLAYVGAGNEYTVTVRRHGLERSYVLRIALAPELLPSAAVSLAIGLLLFAVGLWIGVARPENRTAQAGFGAFMLASLLFWSQYMSAFEAALSRRALFTALILGNIWRPFHLPLGYDFASRFPSSVPENRLWRSIRVALYAVAILLWIPARLPLLADILHLSSRSALLPAWFPLETLDAQAFTLLRVFDFTAAAAMCCALGRNFRMLPDADARRRMRWAGVGLSASIVPIACTALAKIALTAFGRHDLVQTGFINWADSIAMLLVGVAALALAYAIVKHRVLGIRVVIRRGVQYLLARNVLRLILLAPLLILSVQLLLHPERALADILLRSSWIFYVLIAVSAGISLRYRKQLSASVDRKFFRSAYRQEGILLALIESIKSNENLDDISRIAAREIEMALHPSSLYVLFRAGDRGGVTIRYPSNSPHARSIVDWLTPELQQALEGAHTARTFGELETARSPGGAPLHPAAPDMSEMLLVPVTGSDQRLNGALLLGPKKSEEPYSKRDRDLLQTIAGQMAVVSEMVRLKERVREDARVRVEVLGRLDDQQINLVNECPACGACYDRKATQCALDQTALTLTLPVERVIEGKYRLDRRIGTGGMGAVFEASDLRLNRSVAIKILTGQLFGNQDALRRFEREARTAARLEHANIVPIFDYGVLHGGGAFLVMQLVRGQSWRSELKNSEPVAPARAAGWFDQLCEGVAAAHHAGVIHRDLKPENVIISTDDKGDRITILDFGLAKIRTEEGLDAYRTTLGMVMGTFGYMSPEQRSGADVDARGDIYAIGVMTVETLSGRRPPASGASQEWARSALQSAGLGADGEDHQRLRALLERCLASKPQSRFPDIESFHGELVALVQSARPVRAARDWDDDSETMSLGV